MSRKLTTKEILQENLSQSPPVGLSRVVVWLHNIRSLHNVGSVFRSSDAFGVKEVLLSGYTPRPPRPEITKTAIGADESVDWRGFAGHDNALSYLKENNYTVIGIEQTDDSTVMPEFDAASLENICILMGNEVTGIDNELLSYVDEFVSIPQYGQKHSLNVSVAAGVILYALLEKLWDS